MSFLPFEIEKRLKEIESQIGSLGAELIDIEHKRSGGREILVLVVDKPGGITLEDCANINKNMGLWFDEIENNSNGGNVFFNGPYNLEVNSPGLDRALKTEKDFSRVIGKAVRVIWRDTNEKVKVGTGVLRGIKDGVLELENKKGGSETVVLAQVIRANQEI